MTYQPHQGEDLTLKCLPNGAPFDKEGNPRRRYVRITFDGTHLTCDPSEVEMMTEDLQPGRFQIADVFLSEQEYDVLPEFGGW